MWAETRCFRAYLTFFIKLKQLRHSKSFLDLKAYCFNFMKNVKYALKHLVSAHNLLEIYTDKKTKKQLNFWDLGKFWPQFLRSDFRPSYMWKYLKIRIQFLDSLRNFTKYQISGKTKNTFLIHLTKKKENEHLFLLF